MISEVTRTVALALVAVTTVLAAAWGAADAVIWAYHTLGVVPVATVTAFGGGALLTHAIEHALTRSRPKRLTPDLRRVAILATAGRRTPDRSI
jgi:uncharacterized membrane protein YeiH